MHTLVYDVPNYLPICRGFLTAMIAVGYVSLTDLSVWLAICNIEAELKSQVFLAAFWERNQGINLKKHSNQSNHIKSKQI